MHVIVHWKSIESYSILTTVLVGRGRFFERLSGLPITKYLKDFSHKLGLL